MSKTLSLILSVNITKLYFYFEIILDCRAINIIEANKIYIVYIIKLNDIYANFIYLCIYNCILLYIIIYYKYKFYLYCIYIYIIDIYISKSFIKTWTVT